MKSYWLGIPHHFTLQFGGFAPHQKTHGEWSGRVLRRKYRRNISDVNKTYYNKSCKKGVLVLLLVLFLRLFLLVVLLVVEVVAAVAVCGEFRGTCWKSRELLNQQWFQKKIKQSNINQKTTWNESPRLFPYPPLLTWNLHIPCPHHCGCA